jgi:hypothetical protein
MLCTQVIYIRVLKDSNFWEPYAELVDRMTNITNKIQFLVRERLQKGHLEGWKEEWRINNMD